MGGKTIQEINTYEGWGPWREKELKEDLATLAYKAEADLEVQMARADSI